LQKATNAMKKEPHQQCPLGKKRKILWKKQMGPTKGGIYFEREEVAVEKNLKGSHVYFGWGGERVSPGGKG